MYIFLKLKGIKYLHNYIYIYYWIADLNIDFGQLVIDDESLSERSPETSPSFLISLYTVYGLLFHMGNLLKSKHHVRYITDALIPVCSTCPNDLSPTVALKIKYHIFNPILTDTARQVESRRDLFYTHAIEEH